MAKGLLGILAVIVLAVCFLGAVSYFSPTAEASIKVYGTEYTIGQTAKSWLQLLDTNGSYIETANCFVSTDKPDGTALFSNSKMTYQNKGIYFYDYKVPTTIGVYPVTAICYYITNTTTYTASAGAIITGTNNQNSYTSSQVLNNNFWRVDEVTVSGVKRLNIEFNVTGVTEPALPTAMIIDWFGIWNGQAGDNVMMQIYNFTSGTWLNLSNVITNTGGLTLEVSNSIATTTNFTSMGYISGGKVRVRLNDTNVSDTTTSRLSTDYFNIQIIYQTSPVVQQLKGSSEIHVSSPTNSPYEIETLCGSEYDVGERTDISQCGTIIPQNQSISEYPEGEIWDNITVTAFQTQDTYWYYDTPRYIVCNALVEVNQTNSSFNGGTEINMSDMILTDGGNENCRISVPVSLVNGEKYYYTIKLDNYIVYNTRISYYRQYLNIKTFTENLCYPLANTLGYTYTIPINNLTMQTNNTAVYTCELQLDELYWFELFYNQSIISTSLSDMNKYLADIDSTMKDIYQNYNILVDYDLTRKIQSPYVMRTLCGSSDDIKVLLDMSQCAVVVPQNQSYYNYPEGDLLDYINVTARYSMSTKWNYETPEGISCDSIYFVQEWNGTNWTTVNSSSIIISVAGFNNCRISVPVNLILGQTHRYKIQMDNLLIYNMQLLFANQYRYIFNWTHGFCDPIALSSGYTYQTPLQQIAPRTNDRILRTCEQAFDNLWWWDNYYNLSLVSNSVIGIVKYYDDIITIDVPTAMNYYQLLQNYDLSQKMSNMTVNVNINQTDVFAKIQS